MSLLRIYCPLSDSPQQCQWALIGARGEPLAGAGPVAQLPRGAERIQLVLSAADVLISRVRLPQSARRHAGTLLAYAVEEQILGEPDTHQVSWLGSVAGLDVLAVVDRAGLKKWRDALDACGIHDYEVHCETLMLPWSAGEWSLAWNGREGFVRTGEFEGTATDASIDPASPPLSLRLMLDDAKTRGEAPASIAVYAPIPAALPELEAWQRTLGVALRPAGSWDWRAAAREAGISLAQERARWRFPPGTLAKLRPAAWIVVAALAIHTLALVGDWARLASEQRSLRQHMESRFRAAFPEAVAVADPALQMRRKLAETRHAFGQPDDGDFLQMIVKVAGALKGVPGGGLRILSYESGRMTLELADVDEATLQRIVARMIESGMRAEAAPASTRAGSATTVLTVRSS